MLSPLHALLGFGERKAADVAHKYKTRRAESEREREQITLRSPNSFRGALKQLFSLLSSFGEFPLGGPRLCLLPVIGVSLGVLLPEVHRTVGSGCFVFCARGREVSEAL